MSSERVGVPGRGWHPQSAKLLMARAGASPDHELSPCALTGNLGLLDDRGALDARGCVGAIDGGRSRLRPTATSVCHHEVKYTSLLAVLIIS